jgi:hypothetical protein
MTYGAVAHLSQELAKSLYKKNFPLATFVIEIWLCANEQYRTCIREEMPMKEQIPIYFLPSKK